MMKQQQRSDVLLEVAAPPELLPPLMDPLVGNFRQTTLVEIKLNYYHTLEAFLHNRGWKFPLSNFILKDDF